MLSKLFATLFVLLLLSLLRRLREQRFETEYAQQKQAVTITTKTPTYSSKATTHINKKRNKKLRGKYAAVTVRFTPNACEAVKKVAGQRFLSQDAPLMPLQECPRRGICNCFYDYHGDRRTSDERSSFNVQFGILPNYEEGENKQRRWYDYEENKVAKAS